MINKYWGKTILGALAGVFIGCGVGVILYANIGGDTVTVFQDGIHNLMNISYGQASRIYNVVLILLALLLARKYFGIGTIVSALVTGYIIDLTYDTLISIGTLTNYFVLVVVYLVGLVIYSFGLSILINCNLGMNGLDSMIYKINEITKVDYKILRLLADMILTLLGYIMGGTVGIGTAISIIFTGVLIDLFNRIIERRKTK